MTKQGFGEEEFGVEPLYHSGVPLRHSNIHHILTPVLQITIQYPSDNNPRTPRRKTFSFSLLLTKVLGLLLINCWLSCDGEP